MCDVAASELVYSYGVAPLVSDLFDSIEVLRLRLERPVFKRFHVRVKGENKESIDRVYPDDPFSYVNSTGGTSGWTSWKVSNDVAAYVWFDLEKASNFTLGNPLEIGWELVPFSFVVDWMIPIGDYLISLDALKAVDHMTVSNTEKQVQEHCLYPWGRTAFNDSGGERAIRGQNARPARYKKRTHARTISNTIPLPSLPKFELSGSWRRLLNAVSLLVAVRGCKGVKPRYSAKDFPGVSLSSK
jgi:hypothetical protein